MTPETLNQPDGAVGAFLIGARGAVSTCVALGVSAFRSGRVSNGAGLVLSRPAFAKLPVVSVGSIVLGGLDVRRRSIPEAALELARQGVIPMELVAEESAALRALDQEIGAGFFDGPDAPQASGSAYQSESLQTRTLTPRQTIRNVQNAIAQFQKSTGVKRIVVVNLASTEAARPYPESWKEPDAFEADMDRGVSIPASTLYAYAAMSANHAYVNFTPSLGAKPAGLDALARKHNVPHAGCDGKTGETLVKTVLGPMFRDRNLRVLAWEGYNMLGNADGATLDDPAHKASKVTNKDEALRRLLGDSGDLHTRVGIDYVPSLGDWKTAMDFIHFSGFLGTRMTLQFTWSASDSALAAPLVIDLIRLAELSMRRRESGAMVHTAPFFKSPLGTQETDFYRQNAMLEEYARIASV